MFEGLAKRRNICVCFLSHTRTYMLKQSKRTSPKSLIVFAVLAVQLYDCRLKTNTPLAMHQLVVPYLGLWPRHHNRKQKCGLLACLQHVLIPPV